MLAILPMSAGAQTITKLAIAPGSVVGGQPAVGTLTLSKAAPSSGSVCTLKSTAVFAAVPRQVKVAAGKTSATFAVTTALAPGQPTVTITATLGHSIETATIIVKDPAELAISPWPKLGGTSTNTCQGIGPTAKGVVAWSQELYGSFTQSPAVGADGTLFFCSDSGALYAVGQSGQRLWSYQTGGSLDGPPAIGKDGTVYITSEDGYLYALNGAGALRWKYSSSGEIFHGSPAIGPDGTIYAAGRNSGTLYAIKGTGALKWTLSSPQVWGTPVVTADGTIYALTGKYAYSLGATKISSKGVVQWSVSSLVMYQASLTVRSDGSVIVSGWPGFPTSTAKAINLIKANGTVSTAPPVFPAGVAASGPAVATDGNLYFGGSDGNLYAMNSAGVTLWTYPVSNAIYVSPTLEVDGTVVIGDQNGVLTDVTPAGKKKWSFQMDAAAKTSPTIGLDGHILIASAVETLYSVDAAGHKVWTLVNGGTVLTGVSIGADGTLYFGSDSGTVFALDPAGNQKWTFRATQAVYSTPTIGRDGTIYVLDQSHIYALHPTGKLRWKLTTSGTFGSGPAIGNTVAIGKDGTLYVGGNTLCAIGPDGTIKWSAVGLSTTGVGPAIAPSGDIYVIGVGTPGGLFVVNPVDGTYRQLSQSTFSEYGVAISPGGTIYDTDNLQVYVFSSVGKLLGNLGYGSQSMPAIGADGTYFMVDRTQNIRAFSATNILKWTFPAPIALCPYLAISGQGDLYFSGSDGLLYCVGANGTKKWTAKTGVQSFKGPSIGADGTVYVTTSSSQIFAVK
jgi:outer membrane protein assembly factor BamB